MINFQDPNSNFVEESSLNLRVKIDRKVYNHSKFVKDYPVDHNNINYADLFSNFKTNLSKKCNLNSKCMKNQLFRRIPSLYWLSNYKIKEYLFSDVFSGITVAFVHITQGMAYSLLATVSPIYGLYTSFFPVFIYWIFGTSRHISIGTYAVITLMVADLVADLEPKYVPPIGFNYTKYLNNIDINQPNEINADYFLSLDREKSRIMIMTANAFWVGFIQVILFFFRFGCIASHLSESFLNGFLTGSAIHVLTSQIKFIFGIKLTTYTGIGKIPKSYIELFNKLGEINDVVFGISIISILILFFFKIFIDEKFRSKFKVPFPIELFMVIFVTIISRYTNLAENFDVSTVGPIDGKIPEPELPAFFLIKDMFFKSFIIAIVAFANNFSLANLFSKTHKYKIDVNQEFLAYGLSNIFSSFFQCFASGGSLARSLIQNNSGGKTQLVSIVSCIILAFIVTNVGPFFKDLPYACLASIIVVAINSLLVKITEIGYFWKINKIEFFQFLITFLSVVFLDVDVGLVIGIAYYILSHLFRSTIVYSAVLGNIPGTEFYKDIKLYKDAKEIDGLKIIKFHQELHSSNSSAFKKVIYKFTNIKPDQEIEDMKKSLEKKKAESEKSTKDLSKFSTLTNMYSNSPEIFIVENEIKNDKSIDLVDSDILIPLEDRDKTIEVNEDKNNNEILKDYLKNNFNEKEVVDSKIKPKLQINSIIIDCSPINFIDSIGVKTINEVIHDYNQIGINVYLADMNDLVKDRFKRMENASESKYLVDDLIHLSVHDAVTYALAKSHLKI